MDNPFIIAGLACLIGAIVGGGLKAFGVEVPFLKSLARQIVLGILGVLLLAFGLGVFRLPKRADPPKPVTIVNAWLDQRQGIRRGEGASLHVTAVTGGVCESSAVVSITDTTGGRFLPSGTTTVNGFLDEHCEFSAMWTLAPDSPTPTQNTYHDMRVEVVKDGATIGTAQLSVLVHQ